MDRRTGRTVLRSLLVQRHWQKYDTFRAEYVRVAGNLAPELRRTAPSRAQYYRWLAGGVKGGQPYPEACRVLEAMLPPWKASELFGAAPPEGPTPDAGGLLAPLAHSFPTTALEGAWLTGYRFSRVKRHVDIAHVVAATDRSVRALNFPPEPRTEGHSVPYRNEIAADLVGRHVVGVWRNTTDARYFGTIHLAVLPGETVMEGWYTGLNSDVEAGMGPWKWAKLAPASVAAVDFSEVTLQEPGTLFELLDSHSQYDAPLTLSAILENR